MRQKRAFTLIELLVVIAIIALLLSVILPALRLAKEKAKNIQCRANIRSLSVGFRLYTETNDGNIFGYGLGGANNLWIEQIKIHLGDIEKVRYCPSTKISESTASNDWGSANETWKWSAGLPEPAYGSYGVNGFLYSSVPDKYIPEAEMESSGWPNSTSAPNSASVPVFTDAIWVDLWPQDDDFVPANHNLEEGASGGNGSGRNSMLRCIIDRHGGDLSVSFLDGHVEPIALDKMWGLKWSRTFNINPRSQTRSDGSPIYKK